MELSITSKSAEDTRKLGAIFSTFTEGGDVISLSGELGGGKTTFVSGIAAALGSKQPVSSPTFTLINIYDCRKDGRPVSIAHCDLYRIEKISDISDIGLEDYIYDKKYITLIEWAQKIKEEILKDFLEIKFEYVIGKIKNDNTANISGDNENRLRKITFSSDDKYWNKKIYLLKKAL